MKKVAIIFRMIHQYRKEFYDQLHESLLKDNIELTLIYGKINSKDTKSRGDQVDVEWGKFIHNKIIRIGGKELIWQPCLKDLKNKDMVIVENANKLLINYYLMLARRWMGLKFCYWGHGRNMQSNEDSIVNKFKYMYLNKCDWWFAYTQGVKDFLTSKGFPSNKITIVQNAIDTKILRQQYADVSESETKSLKNELGISGENVGIYCGAMYAEKKIDFILDSCYKIKEAVPDFQMLFLGSGIDAHKVSEAAAEHDWIHYVGPKFGQDRVKYFKIASIQIMPGAVGLGILDSFALETPLITTFQDFHGPEIYYLENEKNGLITEENLEVYSKAIIDLLVSKNYKKMIDYCRLCAGKYTIEKMVSNFKVGVLECLNSN